MFEGERVYDDALMLERAIMAEEMAKASECFITGTAAEVTPVSEIGPYRFTPGEVCRTLIADFNAAVQPRKGRRRVGRDREEGRGIGCKEAPAC